MQMTSEGTTGFLVDSIRFKAIYRNWRNGLKKPECNTMRTNAEFNSVGDYSKLCKQEYLLRQQYCTKNEMAAQDTS